MYVYKDIYTCKSIHVGFLLYLCFLSVGKHTCIIHICIDVPVHIHICIYAHTHKDKNTANTYTCPASPRAASRHTYPGWNIYMPPASSRGINIYNTHKHPASTTIDKADRDSEAGGYLHKSVKTGKWVRPSHEKIALGEVAIREYFRANHRELMYQGDFDSFFAPSQPWATICVPQHLRGVNRVLRPSSEYR